MLKNNQREVRSRFPREPGQTKSTQVINLDSKNEKAIQQLLGWTDSGRYIEVIDELWEAWICGEMADGLNANERSERFTIVKELKKFFTCVEDAR